VLWILIYNDDPEAGMDVTTDDVVTGSTAARSR
jgi:hypothetical protein